VGPLVGVTVYRIVQESLTNVLRHAGPAARAEVAITVADREVVVCVRDDGRGTVADSDRPGTGLAAMRERVQLHAGALTHGPRAGGGFEVRAVLPVAEATIA
jgi:signal transduction histidine kinase